MNKTNIEWTDETWNPVTGCTKISTGCLNCYAKEMANRLKLMGAKHYQHHNPFGVRANLDSLYKPIRGKKGKRIFVCSMGDLFHEGIESQWRDQVIPSVAIQPKHTFQVLTKRSGNMFNYMTGEGQLVAARAGVQSPIPNLWLGVTAENQDRADVRIPLLLKTPASVRFVSVEPMLEKVNILPYIGYNAYKCSCGWHETEMDIDLTGSHQNRSTRCYRCGSECEGYIACDWVIVGCESGPKRRECKIEWIREIVAQCKSAGVACFVKQVSIDGKVVKDWNDPRFPEDLKIREFPNENI